MNTEGPIQPPTPVPQPVQQPAPEPVPEILPTGINTEQSQPSTTPETPPPTMHEIPKPKNKFAIIVIILLILTSLASLGYWAYKNYFANISVIPVESPTPIATVDPMANWKTYKNTLLGFELKYPPTVQINKEMNDKYNRSTLFKGSDINFEVMLRSNKNIIFDNYYYMDSPIKRKATLGGHVANVYEFPDGICDGPSCTEPSIAIVAEGGSDLYHLIFSGDVQLSEVENQILSTFSFVSPTGTPVATTKPKVSVKTINPTPTPSSSTISNNSINLSAPQQQSNTYSVKVNYPNGGETLKKGTNVTITWTSTGQFSSFNIYYFDCPSCAGTYITTANGSDSSYVWYVNIGGASLPHQEKIRIVGQRGDTMEDTPTDESDNNFTVTN